MNQLTKDLLIEEANKGHIKVYFGGVSGSMAAKEFLESRYRADLFVTEDRFCGLIQGTCYPLCVFGHV
jgi:hypothetical protein